MCLGVPGRVVRWIERDGLFAQAEVEFAGVTRVCHMACTPGVAEGGYVIVHAGVAIAEIDEAEAQRLFDELAALQDFDGWTDSEKQP